jgi:hypothetical protein
MSTPLLEIRSLIRRHAGPGKIASAQTGIPGLRVTAACSKRNRLKVFTRFNAAPAL